MNTLKKHSVLLMIFLLGATVTPAVAQRTKSKRPVMAPPTTSIQNDPRSAGIVEQLLKQSGQKYVRAPGGVWLVRRTGKNLSYFQVVLSSRSDGLVTEVVVAAKTNLKLTNEAALSLLRLADKLDYIKVGLDRAGDLFVRNEVRLKSLDLEELNATIERVATAADMIYLEVKPFLIKPLLIK